MPKCEEKWSGRGDVPLMGKKRGKRSYMNEKRLLFGGGESGARVTPDNNLVLNNKWRVTIPTNFPLVKFALSP